MVEEKNLNEKFFDEFKKIINNSNFSRKLSESIKLLAKPNATKDIVKHVEKFLKNDRKLY